MATTFLNSSDSSATAASSVLDYAAPTPHDEMLRRLRAAMLVLLCTLLCGGIGWLIEPPVYRAVGYLQIEQTQAGTEHLLDVNTVQTRQAAAATGIASPANLKAATALLPPNIKITPRDIPPKLKVQKIPSSRLVSVSFEHSDPITASTVANAVMSAYTAPGVSTVVMAMTPGRPQKNRLYPIAGLAVGLLLGVFIVSMRSK